MGQYKPSPSAKELHGLRLHLLGRYLRYDEPIWRKKTVELLPADASL